MRIAVLVYRFPALSTSFILNQITGLIDRGHDVDIYAWELVDSEVTHRDVEEYDLLRRVRSRRTIPTSYPQRVGKAVRLLASLDPVPLRPVLQTMNVFKYGRKAASLRLFYECFSMFNSPHYDIVHAQYGQMGLEALTYRDVGVLQGALVTHFRGHDISAFVREQGARVYARLFEDGALFAPVCDHFKEKLSGLGCSGSKIRTHRSGINSGKFPFQERHFPQSGPVQVLTVGRLEEKKGIAYSIQAVVQLVEAGLDIQYQIVGGGSLRNKLEALIDRRDAGSYIKLLGRKNHEQLSEIFKEAHLFVAPSVTAKSGDVEGIPNVLKEAMVAGLPVISTRHSGIPELVEHGKSGYLVPERDADAIAHYLKKLIEHPETWPEMGRSGKARVEAEYDAEMLNDELVRIYGEAVEISTRAEKAK